MSHVGDSSHSHPQHRDDSSTSASSEVRVPCESPQGNIPQSVKQLKFSKFGFPIGDDAGKPPNKLGSLVRSHISIGYKKWRNVPKTKKDIVWRNMKEAFNFKDSQRDIQMRKANNSWRKYKTKLRKNYFKGDDVDKWIENIPEHGVRPEAWRAFCLNEATPEQLAVRDRNKKNKNNCPRKSTHNTGRYGYARAEEKFKEENNRRTPMRVELWLYTHKRKDGSYAPHDEELARKFESLLEIMRQTNQVETLDSGPIYEHFGLDKGGSVRCVGSTISRKAVLSSAFARELLEEVEVGQGELKKEMKSLMDSGNEKLLAQINEVLRGISHNGPNQPPNSNGPQVYSSINGSASYSFHESIPCKVLSHTGSIVAYGTKMPPGFGGIVNSHVMQPREAKVLIETIIDPSYSVWGGEQDHAKKLGDVAVGSFLYWHDDFLLPTSQADF